ncbi:IS110 family transposase (plasmid) [Clostridium estertheticum]|uniref:IS110 family transposase n=1 Tax=Clostridium estertheticum TaxID=238834 RepID=UPI00209BA3D0|nr:IS110 family transposase [Clostridium estertheticum]WAG58176.1 IS110 family transposase [Clostridium estertheticum]
MYKQAAYEVDSLGKQIFLLIEEIKPKSLTIPSIGALSSAVTYAEYGDLAKFDSPSQILSFACLEPGYYQSRTSEHGGHMVKRGSFHLRYTLMNLCIPLIQYNMVFAEYYAKKSQREKHIV